MSVERLCDRPCFARVRGQIDVPIDILFTDSTCREYIGRGVVTVDKDVLLSIPDESIVPYTIEAMVSAICVSGTYLRNNVFELEICVTVVLKVLAKVEILVPSYGFCDVPPCEEFADSVCDEFHKLKYQQIEFNEKTAVHLDFFLVHSRFVYSYFHWILIPAINATKAHRTGIHHIQ